MILDKKIQYIYNQLAFVCQDLLHNSPSANKTREYINSRLSKAIQKKYEFGFFPTQQNLYELTSKISEKDLEYIKVYFPTRKENLPNYSKENEDDPETIECIYDAQGHYCNHNLVMPFRDEHGHMVAFLGRTLLSDDERSDLGVQKYKYNSGCSKNLFLYGLNKAKNSIIEKNYVICVEGQFDCIALQTAGVKNCVAIGTTHLSHYQLFLIHRYTNNIILMLDNDEAGNRSKVKIKKRFGHIANIKTIGIPGKYKDIDEYLKKEEDLWYKGYFLNKINNLEL